jgi:hypothetical protein
VPTRISAAVHTCCRVAMKIWQIFL